MLSLRDAELTISILTKELQWLGFSREIARRCAEEMAREVENDYCNAGMPYGASFAGMLRWLEEHEPRPTPPTA